MARVNRRVARRSIAARRTSIRERPGIRSRMDGLAALLDGPRARGAFLLRCVMEAPWSVRLQDESPLTVTAVVAGEMWAVPDLGE
ncbi:cupin domain-containing protein, partial [Nocardioides sp.]|uniref:cupin domain-containing protein n=1 Tax=Nocardioides sp. TaxID=35761 RepID=UPI0034597039